MRPTENIKQAIKKLSVTASPELHDRVLGDLLKTMEESTKQSSTVNQPNIFGIIMKTKITKFAASAVVVLIIAFIIGVWPEADVTSKVYGISDVPELLRNAKTIHAKGWITLENVRGQVDQDRHDVEEWIDIEKGRYRTIGFMGVRVLPEPHSYWSKCEMVNNGQYRMYIDHGFKRVDFSRLSDFRQKLATRNAADLFLERISLSPGELDGFIRAKEERIDGMNFYVWQKITIDAVQGIDWKSKYWVSPSTGKLRKRQGWTKRETTGGRWIQKRNTK